MKNNAPEVNAKETYDDATWVAARAYMDTYGTVRHQRESFDQFMREMIPTICTENSDVWSTHSSGTMRHCIRFDKIRVVRPSIKEQDGFERSITPMQARLRGLTYSSNVVISAMHDVIRVTDDDEPKIIQRTEYKNILLARVPTMVNSSFCHLRIGNGRKTENPSDQGGFFIVNGIEKSVCAQMKLRTNMAFVFDGKKIAGVSNYVCEVRSCHETKMRSTSTLYITACPTAAYTEFLVSLPFIDLSIPIVLVFKLLGFDAAQMLDFVRDESTMSRSFERLLEHLVESHRGLHNDASYDDIVEWLGREGTKEHTKERKIKYVTHIITSELLPHIGLDVNADTQRKKAEFLAHMVRRLSSVFLGLHPPDDRDNAKCRRIDTSGLLLSLLFRQLFRNYLKTVTVALHRLVESNKLERTNLGDVLSDKKITAGLKYALSTGNWGIMKTAQSQTGVAQMLSRMTSVSATASLRRVNTPINRDGKAAKPRQLHPSTYGVLCPCETPEGAACGLVSNLTLLAHIRNGYQSYLFDAQLLNLCATSGIELSEVRPVLDDRTTFVMVNGRILGAITQPEELLYRLRDLRNCGNLPSDISIACDDGVVGVVQRTIHIATDAGALCRPVVNVAKLKDFVTLVGQYITRAWPSNLLWQELIAHGCVCYLDKHEEESQMIAQTFEELSKHDFQFIDFHPAIVVHGLCAAGIPYADHNQAPRNVYQSAMGKQAIGMYVLNFMQRIDAVAHVLLYPQKPLVTTKPEEILRLNETPAGQNVIVGIMCWSGFKQEDSIIMSKSFVERGGLRSMMLRSVRDEANAKGPDGERFCLVDGIQNGRRVACYSKLGEDGFVRCGERVSFGDVLIGKCALLPDVMKSGDSAPKTSKQRRIERDRSTLNRIGGTQTVDVVCTTKNRDGNTMVRIRLRDQRIPKTGDKCSSRHGQKGVIGLVKPAYDLPFTKDGITPDIIINPHAIPSRMTIAQLIETLAGRLACETGEIIDGTPFTEPRFEHSVEGDDVITAISRELELLGLDPLSEEEMRCGMTGELLKSKVFFGPATYLRLKHMVDDKKHARSRGPTNLLTRQPVEGRAHDGGLRFGEMERDCVISHGCAHVLKDRLLDQSDAFIAPVCTKCGKWAVPRDVRDRTAPREAFCLNCNDTTGIKDLRVPYAFKLTTQEIQAMNIHANMIVKQSTESAVVDM